MRLIDADKLIKEGWVLERLGESNRFITRKSIADVPTVKAKSAVYGEWLEIEKQGRLDHVLYNATPRYRCSACGNDAISANKEYRGHGDYCVEYKWFATSFCPHCGADMRKTVKQ